MKPNPKFNLYDYDNSYDDNAWTYCFAHAQNYQEAGKTRL